jgi:signal transduction histidine kinase/FixJ family two-component response regulator/HPt (histidine-containing phosphotransfer) domain-containing protein
MAETINKHSGRRAVCLLVPLLPLLFSGCAGKAANFSNVPPVYEFYRDIPGVSSGEIKAVEALRESGASFVYGAMTGTESFYTVDGSTQGYSVLFCDWLTRLFDIPFTSRIYTWDQLISGVEALEIDFTGEIPPSSQYAKNYIMTGPITDRTVKRIQLQANRAAPLPSTPRYGFLEDSPVLELVTPYLAEPYVIVPLKNRLPVYNMLRSGEIDVFFEADVTFVEYPDVAVEDFVPLIRSAFTLATRNPALEPVISVLQKYLDRGADYHLTALYNQGTEEYRGHRFLMSLTMEEADYIELHQPSSAIIPIASSYDNYPVCFYNEREQQWQGIALDIIGEIAKLSGMTFYPSTKKTDNRPVIIEMLKSGDVSMVCELSPSEDAEGEFLWADNAYLRDYYALLSKVDYPDVNLNEVRYSRVGLIQGSGNGHLFYEWFPGHTNIREYPAVSEAIDALDRGEIDLLMATTSLLFMIANYQEKPGFKTNLVLDQLHESFFCFGQEEWTLRSIISKAQSFVDTGKITASWTHRVFDYRGKMAQAQIPYFLGLSAMMTVIVVLLLIMHIRNKHEAKRLEAIVRDRTQELEVQTQLAHAASEAKSQFLASMSHEIRTPMNAIIGMSDLMRTDNLDTVQQGYFMDIKKMAKSLLQIINDILDFSKIEAGKMEIVPCHFNVQALFDNICSMSQFTVQAKELEFRRGFDPAIPPTLYGDETRLRQIVTNIVSNAIKYTRQGFVTLNFSRTWWKGKDCLLITVEDSGIGIQKEDLPKLFGVFQQFDSAKNRGIVGTGLGLSITKNLVTMMGGEITAFSEYEKGSVFSVYLPLVEGDPGKIEQKGVAERVSAVGDVSVLVVDDNPINLTVAQGFLGTHNIRPDTAQSGVEAIEMVRKKRYDLVFMDHMMPGMDGIEAAQAIRVLDSADSWYRNMPIVALSANAVTGAREAFLDAGMDDFLPKPIEADSLNMILLKWLPMGKTTMIRQGKSGEWGNEYKKLFTELKELEIIDLNAGLSHVGNNEAAYVQILRQFCAEFDGYTNGIEQHLSEENWKEYSIRLHAMKGVFANIGGDELSKWAYQLEYASKNGDYVKCKAETRDFLTRMREFKEKLLTTSLMLKEAVKKHQAEAGELKKTLEALQAACRQGKCDEADVLAGTLEGIRFSEAADPEIVELCGLIASLDYDEAIGKTETLLNLITAA